MSDDFTAWYQYASGADGFIGKALTNHRMNEFLVQAQQRNLLGILDPIYDQLWLRLQAMPLPRTDQFESDVQGIVESVTAELGIDVSVVNIQQLSEFIRAGLGDDNDDK
jgi:hypothetical protein